MGFDLRKNERSNLDVLLQINNVRLSRYVVHSWLQGLWGTGHCIVGHQAGCSE